MAIVINGSGTVTGLSVGGLPDGTVDAGTLATNSVDSAELIDGAVDDSHIAALAASKLTGALPAISGASLTNLPASGITEADQQRMTTTLQSPSDGVVDITANWERPDTDGFGKIGTGMSHSSGIWTFPSTGYWLVTFNARASTPADARYISIRINTTTDNSSYTVASISYGSMNPASSYWYTNMECKFIFDCENTSTHKVKFSAGAIVNDVQFQGASGQNETYATFIRLGDT